MWVRGEASEGPRSPHPEEERPTLILGKLNPSCRHSRRTSAATGPSTGERSPSHKRVGPPAPRHSTRCRCRGIWEPSLGSSWALLDTKGGPRGTKGYQGDQRSKGHSGESRGTEGDQGGRMGTKEDPGALDLQVSWGGLVAVM